MAERFFTTQATMFTTRFKWMLGLAIPLLGVCAITGWWFSQNKNPNAFDAKEAKRQLRISTLISSIEPKTYKLTAKTTQYLAELEVECANAHEQAQATSDRIRKLDPHLNLALNDVDAPFTTPKSRYIREFFSNSPGLFTDSIQEMILPASFSELDSTKLRNAMAGVIGKSTLGETPKDEDMDVLMAAYSAGANDPLLLGYLWCLAIVQSKEYPTLAERLYENREVRKLGVAEAMVIYRALQSMAVHLAPEQSVECMEESFEAILQAAFFMKAKSLAFDQQVLIYDGINNLVKGMSFPAKCELLEVLQDPADKCPVEEVSQLVAYDINQRLAWSYRGGGYISSIAPDDLAKFEEYSRRAALHALRAWSIAPHQYVLLPKLVELEKSSGTTGQATWFWFRHCLAVVADYQLIYEPMELSLMSRWGGSSQQRLWYINHCIECDLTKSGIFFQHDNTLNVYLQEEAAYPLPATWPHIVDAAELAIEKLRAYSESSPHPSAGKDSLTGVARVLWRSGDFTNLAWLLDVYAASQPAGRSRLERVSADDMRTFAKYASKSGAPSWKAIRTALFPSIPPTKKQSQAVLALLAELKEEAIDDSDFIAFLDGLLRRASILEKFTLGEEVIFTKEDLHLWATIVPEGQTLSIVDVPQMNFQLKEASGDRPSTVDISLDEVERCGGFEFTCKANEHGLMAMVPLYVPPPYRIQFDLIRADDRSAMGGDPYGLMLLCGARSAQDTEGNGHSPMFLLLPWLNQLYRDYLPTAAWDLSGSDFVGARLPDLSKCRFVAEVFDNGFSSLVNGQIWESRLEPITTMGWLQFGRYASNPYTGVSDQQVKYIVCNIRLQKLSTMSIENTESYKEMQEALSARSKARSTE